jgi:hypothetical protein
MVPTKSFIARYSPTFPIGESEHLTMMKFGGWSPMQRTFVPFMFFIDRKGMIRAQYMGSDAFFQNEAANVRKMLDSLIAEGGGPTGAAKPATKAPAAKAPAAAKKST